MTTAPISDANGHIYCLARYEIYLGLIIWKKLKRKRNLAHYKLLSIFFFFVLPEQICYPDVPVSEELTLDTKDYGHLHKYESVFGSF